MTADTTPIASPVSEAVEYLGDMFDLTIEPTGDGGAVVTIHNLEIGEKWHPPVIDLTFEMAFNYPFAPIYPYYAGPDLGRAGGADQPSALQRVEWRGAPRTQISLRANRWDPQVDTAAGCALQVQEWFRRA